ncbi:hypothetical protein G6F42_020568 [Rhizopus arrhizus]|nr:hypothetical protein G6F42_020568 [Rhizopus arrhizus]
MAPIVTTSAITPVALTSSAATASTVPPVLSNPEHTLVRLSPPVRTNSLPANAAHKPAAVSTTPTTPMTPTTPNMPIRASTINSSASGYASPSLTSIDISKIHLPGGGNVHKPAVPAVIPATSSEDKWKRPNGQGNKIEYLFKINHAFRSFRLAHGEMITRKPFFVGKKEFDRLFKNPNTTLKNYQGQPPLSYFVTAWYEGTAERKCDWPTGVRIELNNQNLSLQKVSKKSYIFAVHVFIRLSDNYILGLVKNKVISVEKSERVIDDFLGAGKAASDDDDELVIVQSSVKLSLKCPLTFRKIKQPVKGVDCKHVDVSSKCHICES